MSTDAQKHKQQTDDLNKSLRDRLPNLRDECFRLGWDAGYETNAEELTAECERLGEQITCLGEQIRRTIRCLQAALRESEADAAKQDDNNQSVDR